MHILILDDDVLLLKSLRRLLKLTRPDWVATCCSSADVAAQVLVAETVDLVIADLMMPGTTGDAFLELARRLAPGAVRIGASGKLNRANASRMLRIAHQIIQKPYSIGTISAIYAELAGQLEAVTATRQLALSALDVAAFAYQCDQSSLNGVAMDTANASASSIAMRTLDNPWRCVLAMQAVTMPVFAARPESAGVADALIALGLEVVRNLGHTDRSEAEEPLVNAGRLLWIGRQSQSAAALARQIATDLFHLRSMPGSRDAAELAHAATLFARIAEPLFPVDADADRVLGISAQALAVRGVDSRIVHTMLSARRSEADSVDDIASTATQLAIALTGNPSFPLLTPNVRVQLRVDGGEELLTAWRRQAQSTFTVLSAA